MNIDIRQCDNLELLAELKNSTVDLIYCDILYGTGRKFKDYQDLKPKREVIEEHYIPRIKEMHRVLKPHGRLVMSDPTCEQPINQSLRKDDRLRALCLSGSIPIDEYVKMLTDAGFGTIEIRARKPYRILDPLHYSTKELIYIESIEVAAIKDTMPSDGPCVFTGKTAIFYGKDDYFDDKAGHVLLKNQPLAICDKTAASLTNLNRNDIYLSRSTFHYDGGGCC